MAVRCTHAIGAGIATADHHHMLAGGRDRILAVARVLLVLRDQELQREMYAFQFAPRDRQVARRFGASGKDHGIELFQQHLRANGLLRIVGYISCRRILADEHGRLKLHAFGLHLRHAPVDQALVELEVGDTVAQQSADAAVLLENRHAVADARQLLRCC